MRLYTHIITRDRVVFRSHEGDTDRAVYVRMSKQEWIARGRPASIEHEEQQ